VATDPEESPETDPKSGLACFIDQHRVCGADCMSYLPQAPEGAAYQGENWAHCLLLVNSERTGKHVVILVDLLKKAQATATRGQKPPGVT
jgi:hypothetical protein